MHGKVSIEERPCYYDTSDSSPIARPTRGGGVGDPEEKKIKPTLKRPFIIPEVEDGPPKITRIWNGNRWEAATKKGPPIVGCAVFDGLCICQENHDEINCKECIKATFEAFLKGCRHREVYVDQYGTVRCAACKIELDQVEDSEPYEADDFLEEDDPPETDDADMILNGEDFKYQKYRTWGLEGAENQERKPNDPVDPISRIIKLYHKGKHDCLQEIPITENPYKKEGKWYERRAWHKGWMQRFNSSGRMR